MVRVKIADFGVIQKNLAGATVTVFLSNADGSNTGTLAPLYEASSGSAQRNNPQVLDENGNLDVDCYVEASVMCEITNLPGLAERQLKKIRQNPLDYALPVTSTNFESANVVGATADAEAAAAAALVSQTAAAASASTATTQAGIATTQAGISTTQAGIATTQAGIATTQAGIATAAAAGQKIKAPARAATTGALPTCTYANGASGVGATLTATVNGALPAQDTVTLIAGEALLVKNQASAQHNGLYVVTQVGTGGTPWILTRLTDSDTWTEIVAALVTVMEGSAGTADTQFLCTSNAGGTMGTTAITWTQINANIADGAVSSTAKLVDNIVTFIKINTAAIASLGDWAAGTASKLLTAANFLPALAAAIGFRKIYVSPQQVITSAGALTLAHGLPSSPSLVTMQLVCQTAEQGYSIGQVINIQLGVQDSSSARGVSVISNATNLTIRYGSTATAFIYIHGTTGAQAILTNANWRAVFIAWG